MKTRRLWREGPEVSEVGFGAWAIGGSMWGGADDQVSGDALRRALDLGVRLIDTALVYGDGRSERLIGEVLRDRPNASSVLVASKVPPKNRVWPAKPGTPLSEAFPAAWIRSSAERTLKNVGRPIDLLQLHVWLDAWTDDSEWSDEMSRLRDEGKIRAIGVSINDHQPGSGVRVARSGKVQTVQVIYNIFDQTPDDALLPACQVAGVGVLARVPLDEGSLTGKLTPQTQFPADDFRSRYFAGSRLVETCYRVDALKWLVPDEAPTLAQAALRFCLAHPAVSAVIPGMRTVAQVEDNIAAASQPLSAPARERLRGHRWDRNFYA